MLLNSLKIYKKNTSMLLRWKFMIQKFKKTAFTVLKKNYFSFFLKLVCDYFLEKPALAITGSMFSLP